MAKQVGLEALATYVPEGRIDFSKNQTLMNQWAITPEFLKNKTGFLKVARKKVGDQASDLAMAAFLQLQKKTAFDTSAIDLVVVVTQNPDTRLPHVSAILHDRLGLSSTCAAFDISHGCAGYVYGIAVTQSFMKEHGLRKALLFTSDPYSGIVDPADRDTALLFGDAASVTLLSEDPVWVCGKFSFCTNGQHHSSLRVLDKTLVMDGLQVFNFAAKQIPLEITKVLQLNQLKIEDIDSFLIHSGSRFIVDTIVQRAGLPPGRCPFGDTDVGNTISTSLPLLLEKEFLTSRTVILTGFGVGLSSASTVLRSTAR